MGIWAFLIVAAIYLLKKTKRIRKAVFILFLCSEFGCFISLCKII